MSEDPIDFLVNTFLRNIKSPDGYHIAYLLREDLKFFNNNLKSNHFGSHEIISFILNKRMCKNSTELNNDINLKSVTNSKGEPITRKTRKINGFEENFIQYHVKKGVKIEDIFYEFDKQTPYFFRNQDNNFNNGIMFDKLVTRHKKTGIKFIWREKRLTHEEEKNSIVLTDLRNEFVYFKSIDDIRLYLIELLEDVMKRECHLKNYEKIIKQNTIVCSLDNNNVIPNSKKRGRKK